MAYTQSLQQVGFLQRQLSLGCTWLTLTCHLVVGVIFPLCCGNHSLLTLYLLFFGLYNIFANASACDAEILMLVRVLVRYGQGYTDWIRVRTILVLGYWVLGNIHRYWVVLVLLLGDIFCCSDTIQYQSDSSQYRPQASEQLFSSTCDLYSDRRNRLSEHHDDMLLFIKHNHCHHHRVLEFFCGHCYAMH